MSYRTSTISAQGGETPPTVTPVPALGSSLIGRTVCCKARYEYFWFGDVLIKKCGKCGTLKGIAGKIILYES